MPSRRFHWPGALLLLFLVLPTQASLAGRRAGQADGRAPKGKRSLVRSSVGGSWSLEVPPRERGKKREPITVTPADRRVWRSALLVTSVSYQGPLGGHAAVRIGRAQEPSLRECHERALLGGHAVRGDLTVSLALSPRGTVAGLEIREDKALPDALRHCLRTRLLGLRFPARAPGGHVSIDVWMALRLAGAATEPR